MVMAFTDKEILQNLITSGIVAEMNGTSIPEYEHQIPKEVLDQYERNIVTKRPQLEVGTLLLLGKIFLSDKSKKLVGAIHYVDDKYVVFTLLSRLNFPVTIFDVKAKDWIYKLNRTYAIKHETLLANSWSIGVYDRLVFDAIFDSKKFDNTHPMTAVLQASMKYNFKIGQYVPDQDEYDLGIIKHYLDYDNKIHSVLYNECVKDRYN